MITNILQNCTKPTKLKNGLIVSCGTCIVCRARKQNEWNLRAIHELKESCGGVFITLTYKNRYLTKKSINHIPIQKIRDNDCLATLNKTDIQKFNKRLRKYIDKNYNRKIKIIYCGEYGESLTGSFRPHWHLIVFNATPQEINQEVVNKLWGMGKVDVSDVNATKHAIMYVTGYTRKKQLSRKEKQNYKDTGREPPFIRYSQGIGKKWAMKNYKSWIKSMSIAYENSELRVPRYYLNLIKKSEGVTYKVPLKFRINTGDVKVDETIEYRYYMLENLLGEKTSEINEKLFKQKYDDLEKLKADKDILKRDDCFEIWKEEESQIDVHWKLYHKKCEDYVNYFYDEKRFVRDKTKALLKTEEPKKKKPSKYKEPEVHNFGELNAKAKQKEYEIKKGGFGGREKIELFDCE